ncbi:MAG: exodeoxyribonuclease VII small subunit [Planctomycetota bacterium]
MPKKKKNVEAEPEPEFEEALHELEAIVRRLEQGGGSLEKALEEYQSAIGLMKICHTKLAHAERRVEILSGVDADGNPVSEPLETSSQEGSLEEKQKSRSKKRSAQSSEDKGGLF